MKYKDRPLDISVDKLVSEPPFSEQFKIDPKTLERIKKDMELHGYDRSAPIIAWHPGEISEDRLAGEPYLVIDGHARLMAAKQLSILIVPVVLREFKTEDEAIEYAIRNQWDRRNLPDVAITEERPEPKGKMTTESIVDKMTELTEKMSDLKRILHDMDVKPIATDDFWEIVERLRNILSDVLLERR